MQLFNKFKILLNAVTGYCIKVKIDIFGIGNIEPLPSSSNDQIIVSLTSYGRRVKSVVYYTLVSLLKQTERPSKIILWLDESWNDDNVPDKLKSLTKYGVEIRFCEDIRSYKKLIPTLREFPSKIIVTVDDDVIYNKHLVKSLMDGYRSNERIQCTVGSIPKIIEGNFAPYSTWTDIKHYYVGDTMVPIGVGGVLYPPASLDKEVLNINAFTTLAPNADDLWFWFMATKNGTFHSCVDYHHENYSFDALYQYFHKGSALTHRNAGEGMNDIQLKNILNHYKECL